MQIIMSGRGIPLSEPFKRLVERKVGKLARRLPKITAARVVCSAEAFRYQVRLTLTAKRRLFTAVTTAEDLVAAVDLAVDALTRQVRQAKDRRARRRPRGVRAVGPPAAMLAVGAGPDLIEPVA